MESKQKDPLFYEKLRTVFLGAILLVMVALLIGAVVLVGSLRHYETQIGNIVSRLEVVSGQLEALDTEKLVKTANELADALEGEKVDKIVTSLDEVADELSNVDWTELAGNINKLAVNAQTSMTDAQEALTKLKDLDIESLNQAVKDLQDAIEPMSKFAKLFG